jgi:putative glutamine amidotransferase
MPIIGITADQHKNRHRVSVLYAKAVHRGGGIPILLPPIFGQECNYLAICDGFVFSGGNDPSMEQWNIPTHPKATPVAKNRQAFETSLLGMLQELPDVPVLGVCLGMQWMGLLAGGSLEQDLLEPFASHHKDGDHTIHGELGEGIVHTNHHQALTDAGSLSVVATAEDGVIEGVRDSSKNWYVGVQWHPERTENVTLGQNLFAQLVTATKSTIQA